MLTSSVLALVLASAQTESPTVAPSALPSAAPTDATVAPSPPPSAAPTAVTCTADSCGSCDPLTGTCIFYQFDRVSRPEPATCEAGTAARYASWSDDTITACTPCSKADYLSNAEGTLCTACSEKYLFPKDDDHRVMTCDGCAEGYELVKTGSKDISRKVIMEGVYLHHTEYFMMCQLKKCWDRALGAEEFLTRKTPGACDCCASEGSTGVGSLECCDEGECADANCDSESAPTKMKPVAIALVVAAVVVVFAALAGLWCCCRSCKRTTASNCLHKPLVEDNEDFVEEPKKHWIA